MTAAFVPLTGELVAAIKRQPEQQYDLIDAQQIEAMLPHCAGEVLIVAGEPLLAWMAVRVWPGRQLFNVVMSEAAGAYMVRIVRRLRRWLDLEADPRVDTTVRTGWAEGYRFAELLGFKARCRLDRYDHLGRSHVFYERVT